MLNVAEPFVARRAGLRLRSQILSRARTAWGGRNTARGQQCVLDRQSPGLCCDGVLRAESTGARRV